MKINFGRIRNLVRACGPHSFAKVLEKKRTWQITMYSFSVLVVMFGVFIYAMPKAHAATAGPNAATAATTGWTSYANSEACDSTYATNSIASNATGTTIQTTGYGFAIPTGSMINGIQVDMYEYATTGSKNKIQDSTISLVVGGSASGSNLATTNTWPSTRTDVVYGGSSNLWGLTPTVAQVNASNFGVEVIAKNVKSGNGSSALVAELDCADITITYTAPVISLNQSAYQFYGNQNGTDANGTSWSQATAGAPFTAAMNGAALSFNGKMWEMGGQYGTTTTYLNTVYCSYDGANWYDSTASGGCGGTSAAGWSARSMFGAVVFNSNMWVLGGMVSGSPNAQSWCSSDGATWYDNGTNCGTATAGFGARYGLSAVVFNNKIYVIGGNNGSSTLNDVWSSSDGATWTEVTSSGCSTACTGSFPARSNAQVFVFGGKLYIMGGFDGSTYYNDVWSSTNGATWTQVTANGTGGNAPWSGRGNVGGVVYNGDMWIMGGWNGTSYLDDAWCSPDGTNWYDSTASGGCGGMATASWSGRNAPSSVVYQNRMWIIGGKTGTSSYVNDVWDSPLSAIGVGSSLASADTAITSPADTQPFRLRMDVNVANVSLAANGQYFKLQYAPLSGTCAASTYSDVTDTTPVAYYNNPGGGNNQDISSTSPTDPASPTGYTSENYQGVDAVYFPNTYAITSGYDGVWDFALNTYNTLASTSYCLRMVQYTVATSSETALNTYTNYPEITTPASSIEQSSFEFYKNIDAPSSGAPVDVGTPLTELNTPVDLTKFDNTGGTAANISTAPFRLRWNVANIGGGVNTSGLTLSLQYAEQVSGSCAATATSGTWANVSTSTPIQFYTGNTNATNGDTLVADANDPTDGTNTIDYQTYVDANTFSNSQAAINGYDDGLWDFALAASSTAPHANYCLRLYNNSTSSAVAANNSYPEIDMGPTMVQLLRGREWWNSSDVREYKDL